MQKGKHMEKRMVDKNKFEQGLLHWFLQCLLCVDKGLDLSPITNFSFSFLLCWVLRCGMGSVVVAHQLSFPVA